MSEGGGGTADGRQDMGAHGRTCPVPCLRAADNDDKVIKSKIGMDKR